MSKLQVVELNVDAEQAQSVWNEFERFKSRLMTEDDRYEVGGALRLNRQGCAKLATVFGLSEPEPPQIVQTPLSEKHVAVQVSTVVAAPDGRRAFGVGGCTTTEILSNRPKNERAYHDAVARAHTRAKERAIADLVGGGEVTAEEIGGEAPRGGTASHQTPQGDPIQRANDQTSANGREAQPAAAAAPSEDMPF